MTPYFPQRQMPYAPLTYRYFYVIISLNSGSNSKHMEASNGTYSSEGFRKNPKAGIQPA